jgi:hypothetical protein
LQGVVHGQRLQVLGLGRAQLIAIIRSLWRNCQTRSREHTSKQRYCGPRDRLKRTCPRAVQAHRKLARALLYYITSQTTCPQNSDQNRLCKHRSSGYIASNLPCRPLWTQPDSPGLQRMIDHPAAMVIKQKPEQTYHVPRTSHPGRSQQISTAEWNEICDLRRRRPLGQ